MEMATRRREQEVWQVLDDLWAMHGEAKNLTGEAIRDRLVVLGKSRGSPNEIYKYKKTWVKSRGVLDSAHSSEVMVSDPISRAVHLVHEKLQEEAHEQINELKAHYEQLVQQKDETIAAMRESLNKVVIEFGELERELKKSQQENLELQNQVLAEVELRKAGERELQASKVRHEQEHNAHEVLLREIKTIHEQHLASLSADKHALEQRGLQQVALLSEEKKLLGQQFSEQLNQLKIDVYNRDITNKSLLSKLTESSKQIAELLERVHHQEQHINAQKREEMDISVALKTEIFKVRSMGEQQALKIAEIKQLSCALKKAEKTISRLRYTLNA